MKTENQFAVVLEKLEPQQRQLIEQIAEELGFIQERLADLRKLPFLQVDQKNNTRQRATPAAKQYKELMQTYTNGIKLVNMILSRNSIEEEDDFQKFLEEFRGGGV